MSDVTTSFEQFAGVSTTKDSQKAITFDNHATVLFKTLPLKSQA